MTRKLLKRILKVTSLVLVLLFGVLVVLFFRFSQPKTDEAIIEEISDKGNSVYISHKKFRDYSYRVLDFQSEIDPEKYNLVFVHGSIGSAMDFSRYCVDSTLLRRANIRSYDRIGYGRTNTGGALESIAEERLHLEEVLADMNKERTILVGYSYGGPIVLNSKDKLNKIILIAPAVHAASEPMPWAIKLYEWKFTRWILPDTWKAASKEKLSHQDDLYLFENQWIRNKNSILSIHGDDDGIVPIENSYYLKEIFSSEQFEMLTLKDVGHGLVWSEFDTIVEVLRNETK